MIAEQPRVYHLAWHRHHIAEPERFLAYILVPKWLGVFRGSIDFEAISSCGRPLANVRATMRDLASPRKPEDTEGFGHPIEMRLIRVLASRAVQASHVLPALEPSLRLRGWSRMELSDDQRLRLLRAGGVAPV